MNIACDPKGKPSVCFSGDLTRLAISLVTAPSGWASAAGFDTAPCLSLFAGVLPCVPLWERYGICNARALYIGGFRNSAVSPISEKPEALDLIINFLALVRPPFLPCRWVLLFSVSGDLGCATRLVFSKPCFSCFLSDALNASDIDDWWC